MKNRARGVPVPISQRAVNPANRPRRLLYRVALAGLALAALSPFASAQESPQASRIRAELTRLFSGIATRGDLGCVVAPADGGPALFEFNPDKPLKPASVLKLFTTAAALEHLGVDFRFETGVYVSVDELWVRGGGDPALGDERLATRSGRTVMTVIDDWAAALRTRGRTEFSRLVLDDSIFDQQFRNPDWPGDQQARWYQAPVGGLNFNDNCIDIALKLSDGAPRVFATPPLPPEFFELKTTRGKKTKLAAARDPASDIFRITGTLAGPAALEPVAVGNPTTTFGFALKQALADRGIAVRGDVVRRTLAPSRLAAAEPLATHATPLPDVVWRCNTFSQNLFAEALCKALAAYHPGGQRSGVAGSWAAGTQQVRATITALGIDSAGLTLRDGSGLSHQNRATAGEFVRLLQVMPSRPGGAAFRASLADAGEDGSMRRRFKEDIFRGRLIGKTGTIQGVHALAGYATAADGSVWAFAVLINNGAAPESLSERVCRVLVGNE